jgi:hypothetical protein
MLAPLSWCEMPVPQWVEKHDKRLSKVDMAKKKSFSLIIDRKFRNSPDLLM